MSAELPWKLFMSRNQSFILTKYWLHAALLTALLALGLNSTSSAQTLAALSGGANVEEADEAANPLGVESIGERMAALEAELAVQTAKGQEEDSAETPATLELLLRIQGVLERQVSLTQKLQSAQPPAIEEAELEPSVFKLSGLYEDLHTVEQNNAHYADILAGAKEKLANAQKELSAQKIKQAEAPSAAAMQALEAGRLAVRLAEEEVNLASLEAKASLAGTGNKHSVEKRIASYREQLAGKKAAPLEALSKLGLRISRLERQKESVKASLETTRIRQAALQERMASTSGSTSGSVRELKALGALRDMLQERLAVYAAELSRLEKQEDTWVRWSRVLSDQFTRQELHDWSGDAAKRLETLELEQRQSQSRIAELRNRIESVESNALQAEASASQTALDEELATQLTALQTDQSNSLRRLAGEQRLTHLLLNDIQQKIGGFSLFEFIAQLTDAVSGLWNYEITTIEDAPFTLGSLTLGLTLFAAGLWISRRVSRGVERLASNRFKLDPGASHALQVLSFYAMLIGIGLLALRMIHFPLTAFAFLGGALAIGVGFGSQNVMNNFISGLILMLERPVRAADVVEVDGNFGTIEKIGARSTQIRSNDGRHIVVPNSFFLESNVVNWTLSDDLIRAKVEVGVAYGSPTELVASLMKDVVAREPKALDQPQPVLIFDAFGDNSLNFAIHFWVRARAPMAVRQIESSVRFALDKVFRENELVIAFPQRDVHLDTLSPLQVTMVGQGSGTGE